MLVYPEVQRKAQKEIDSVIRPGRLPDFSDQESLPYVNCVLQECKRYDFLTSVKAFLSTDA